MKKLFFSATVLFLNSLLLAQNYTWMKGPTAAGSSGVYGTMGVSNPNNNPSGRHGCGKWVDLAGNLWMFGGEGYGASSSFGWLNDLWKYNITTNEWTWIRGSNQNDQPGNYGVLGVASPSNEPGAREFMACWTDAAGNFWMFGGDGFAATSSFGRLGDLWKYNPVTNEWTWMKGFNSTGQTGVYGTQGTASPLNMPGCRYGSGTWQDAAGNLYLYGGRGLGASGFQGYLNDMWKYNISTNEWTWVNGSNATGTFGQYGTINVPATGNSPGGRYLPNCWTDVANNVYLFGGFGMSASTTGYLGDFWKYDPVAATWTWLKGSNTINATGVYGTLGVSAASTMPGSRRASATWRDNCGNLWLFGGEGSAASNNDGMLNDLFRYNTITNEFTWMKGASQVNVSSVYGTQGVESITNIPGSRTYNTWWKDLSGDFWLLGGEEYDTISSTSDNTSDLWRLRVPANPDTILVSALPLCSGTPVSFTAVGSGANTQWFSSPTSTAAIANGSVFSTSTLTAANTASVYNFYAEANNCTTLPRSLITVTVNPLPVLSTAGSQTLACSGYSASLSASGANTYTWSTVPPQNGSVIAVSPNTSTNYTVTGTGSNGCNGTASTLLNVVVCPGIAEIKGKVIHELYPNPSMGQFKLVIQSSFNKAELNLINTLGQIVYRQEIQSAETFIKPELSKGVYHYQLMINNNQKSAGKLVIE